MKPYCLPFIAAVLALISCRQNQLFRYNDRADDVILRQNLFDTSMKDGISCYRIPSLVTAPNGDLVAATDERVTSCGDLRECRDINIVIRRSRDNGETWGPIETVADFPDGQSASDPSMTVDAVTKEVFLFYNYMDLDNNPGVYRFHVKRSGDNGKTWSEHRDITGQIADTSRENDFKFITSGRGSQTSDGALLHTMVDIEHGLHAFASEDHGESWHTVSPALIPGDESKIIELPDGRWMVNSRINGGPGRHVYVSGDRGKSWSSRPDTALTDPGCNAAIICYTAKRDGFDKDRLLFVNPDSKEERRNLTVRISYDNGDTWSNGKVIYEGKAAYSSITILRNGDIGVLYEKDDYASIEFVVFSLEWLTDNADNYRPPRRNTQKQ